MGISPPAEEVVHQAEGDKQSLKYLQNFPGQMAWDSGARPKVCERG